MEIKNVAIVGCGALGMMYATQIGKTLPPGDVFFIADEQRLSRYVQSEFLVNGDKAEFRFVPPHRPDDCPIPDLLIFTVKYGGLESAVELAREYVGSDTIILSFLNGITSEEVIGKTYNPAKILHSMVAGMDATKIGESLSYSAMGFIAFGGVNSGVSETDIKRVAAFFDSTGLRYELPDDIIKAMWWKFMLNVGINQTSALLKAPYGLFQKSQYARDLMESAMLEVYKLAEKADVRLDQADMKRCMDILGTLSPFGKTSMCQDIEAGRHTEVDLFSGAVIDLGIKFDVETPVNKFLYNAIKALESSF